MGTEALASHRCGVLVVDSDAEVRELLRVLLTAEGYMVAAVGDGRSALTYLRSHVGTCIVLLDPRLPSMDGERFRAAQLHDRSLAWIPVVLMSGGVEAAAKARGLGVRGFLRKPLDLDQVREILAAVTCLRTSSRRELRDLH